ncbi:hypothetical protein GGH92_001763, partial [Coemansia sp. RSA 2673]
MNYWGILSRGFQKLPMVFEHDQDHYYIVWETSFSVSEFSLEWWTDAIPISKQVRRHNIVKAQYKMIDESHHRYSAIIGPVGHTTK